MANICLVNQDACALRGQARDFVITVLDDDGDAVDLSSATVTFGISISPETGYTLSLTPVVSGASSNIITAPMSSTQCATLTAANYYFECWVTIGSDDTPVAIGELEIKDNSRTA